MHTERQPSRAEQRMQAVAKLKRAASLPRMKDGRRPPMHVEAVSEGEKIANDEDKKADVSSPPSKEESSQNAAQEPPQPVEAVAPQSETDVEPNPGTIEEQEQGAEADIEAEEPPATPEPTGKAKRRRRRSRPRWSNDWKGQNIQPAEPQPLFNGDSSQDEAAPQAVYPPLNFLTPVPSPFAALQRTLLRSPTPNGEAFLYPAAPLPSLEVLQGLYRSNSAGGNAVARNEALRKLTGGQDSYDPSPSTPPSNNRLGRNNTVSGGESTERTAARRMLLSRLNGRVARVPEAEPVGTENVTPTSTAAKRRRRGSTQGSSSGQTGTSDSDLRTTAPNTPLPPSTPIPSALEHLVILRSRSTTPNQIHHAVSMPKHTNQYSDNRMRAQESIPPLPTSESTRPNTTRRRSVLVEDDDQDDIQESSNAEPPLTPPPENVEFSATQTRGEVAQFDGPESRLPSNDIPAPSLRSASRNETLPITSPFERPYRDEEEERVVYRGDVPRTRTPYRESPDRGTSEISWIAEPVPVVGESVDGDDDEDQDEQEEQDYQERPLSAQSFNGFHATYEETSPRISMTDSKSYSDAPAYIPNSPSLTQPLALPLARDDNSSSQSYPTRLAVASPIQSDRSPLTPDFNLTDTDDRAPAPTTPAKRNGDASPSPWEKMKKLTSFGSTSGRRSRTNSLGRREQTDSSFSRESGTSLTSGKNDSGEPIMPHHPITTSASAAASVLSLTAPYPSSRGNASPIPPSASAEKYQGNSKLHPFPGLKMPDEQRVKLSASSPDITLGSSANDDDQPPHSATRSLTPIHTVDISRDRISPVSTPSTTRGDAKNGGIPKLPMNLPGVKQWLNKNKWSSRPSSPPPIPLDTQPAQTASKKLSLSDLLRRGKESELSADWEEINSTPTSTSGNTLQGRHTPADLSEKPSRAEPSEQERTPRAKLTVPVNEPFIEASTHPSSSPRPDLSSSVTPDPSSSISDYLTHSTSGSSSASLSQYSVNGAGINVVLERLDDSYGRGSRGPSWASAVEDQSRKLILSSPVLQVVNSNTVKDRFLFLFSDILVIAKPVLQDKDNFLELSKPSPPDRRYIVKSVVRLNQLRLNGDRFDGQTRTSLTSQRTPLVRAFIAQFAKDPDMAISNLFSKSGLADDPIMLGQLLFKTWEADRSRLGEYLAKRTSKAVLRAYLDSFGFSGLRLDRALRAFLQTVHIPTRSSYGPSPLEYLLDAFASRWYEANAQFVAYDKDLAIRLVRALVKLNELLHEEIASEPGSSEVVGTDIAEDDFTSAFKRYDVRGLVPDELLKDTYNTIYRERLAQARAGPASADMLIHMKKPIPPRLTYKMQSEPIVVRIPQPDAQFAIHLYGQDLIFDPPVLTFARSSEASFRITGTSLGAKSILMCRSGPNAILYSGLALSTEVIVERAFMRHTFQLAFANHVGEKRRYMFSVDDRVLQQSWIDALRQQIMNAGLSPLPSIASAPGYATFYNAAQTLSFKVLQETLLGLEPPSKTKAHPVASRQGNASPSHNKSRLAGPLHIRSKSRSKFYHRHGAGKNELELNGHSHSEREDDVFQDKDIADDTFGSSEGPIWSHRDLVIQCQQNSSIALVLSYLQVGSLEQGQQSS